MGKRIFLFLVTNLAVMVTLSIVMFVLGIFFPGIGRITHGNTLQLVPLMIFCLVWGMGGAFISLQLSRWMAKKSMDIRLLDGSSGNRELDWLHDTVSRLARQAGLPMPEVGFYDSPEVNAFATGPSKSRSLVAVSTGLLRSMDKREVEGVLAHELAHISNGDMVTMTLIQGVVNAFVMFFARIIGWAVRQALSRDEEEGSGGMAFMASFAVTIVCEILFGILGSMVTAAFSRWREFRADAGGAGLAGRDSMIAALRRLQAHTGEVDTSNAALQTFKISGAPKWMALFSTHPPLAQRIAALGG